MRYFDFTDILASITWIATNNPVKKFEKEFSNYIGIPHVLATSYGRTALYLGLKSLGVKDREVIIPTFICTVVRHAVIMAGAKPIFADISYNNFGYDLPDLKKKITSQTKVIVITHFFGMIAPNIEEIISLAEENGIFILEDCAHSLGAKYKNKKVGAFGNISIYSLTKNTLNFGGGVFATYDDELFQKGQKILQNETHTLMKTIADFPLILSYGIEQIINKAVFDRVGNSIFKWWLIKLPALIIKLRSLIITVLKLSLPPSKKPRKASFELINSCILSEQKQYPFSLSMNQITASVARNQLRKLDILNEKRRIIAMKIIDKLNYPIPTISTIWCENVYSFIVLRFKENNIMDVINICRKMGLLLRATWPTHQTICNQQATTNLRRIEHDILTWNVNPMLTEKEINKFIAIIRSIPGQNS